MPDPQTLGPILALLPTGHAWTRDPNSAMYKLTRAVATEIDRAMDFAGTLVTEIDPRVADDLIPEWEALMGLPGGCDPYPTAAADRRLVIHAALVGRGSHEGSAGLGYASPLPLWRRIADVMGYAAPTITERDSTSILRAGGPIDVPIGLPSDVFWVDFSVVGVSAAMDAALECILRRTLHAHVTLSMEFT